MIPDPRGFYLGIQAKRQRDRRPPKPGPWWPAHIAPIEVMPALDMSIEALRQRNAEALERQSKRQPKAIKNLEADFLQAQLQPGALPSGRGRKKRKAKS